MFNVTIKFKTQIQRNDEARTKYNASTRAKEHEQENRNKRAIPALTRLGLLYPIQGPLGRAADSGPGLARSPMRHQKTGTANPPTTTRTRKNAIINWKYCPNDNNYQNTVLATIPFPLRPRNKKLHDSRGYTIQQMLHYSRAGTH